MSCDDFCLGVNACVPEEDKMNCAEYCDTVEKRNSQLGCTSKWEDLAVCAAEHKKDLCTTESCDDDLSIWDRCISIQ